MTDDARECALRLSHILGDPSHDWAILAEGNVSAAAPDGTMFIKASGVSMLHALPEDYVQVRLRPILDLLDDPSADDDAVANALMDSRIDSRDKRPSVEAILHAVCLDATGAAVVGHTHPTSVNALLCSEHASALTSGSLFPDQIVVLGKKQLLMPYTDPGLELARLVRHELTDFIAEHGEAPKVIYLRNHGMFALGGSADEVVQVTQMAVKCARILGGALSVGRPVYLTPAETARIDTRPDELLRRQVLAEPVDHRTYLGTDAVNEGSAR